MHMDRSSSAFSVRETHGILLRPDNRIYATSEGLGWSSLYASAQRQAPFEGSYRAVRDHCVALNLGSRPVAVSIGLGKTQEPRAVRATETLHLYLRDSVLREVAAELVVGDPAHLELVPRLGEQDPLIEQLALGIREAMTDADPASVVYADQIARTLGARLIRAHSNCSPQPAEPPKSGLTRTLLTRAIEFMDANLAERLSLDDIAGAAGLSPGHFSRQFKASTGMTPHKYLVRMRLERAKRLLRETDRSIAQIASECGFSSQEHMTRFFSEVSVTTPAVFRRAVRV
jgi:AraC family transcriptional regulator